MEEQTAKSASPCGCAKQQQMKVTKTVPAKVTTPTHQQQQAQPAMLDVSNAKATVKAATAAQPYIPHTAQMPQFLGSPVVFACLLTALITLKLAHWYFDKKQAKAVEDAKQQAQRNGKKKTRKHA